jgi:hypothetical protein
LFFFRLLLVLRFYFFTFGAFLFFLLALFLVVFVFGLLGEGGR